DAQRSHLWLCPTRQKCVLEKGLFYEQFLNLGPRNANKTDRSADETNRRKTSSYSVAATE
ncbi:MAG: hypothetical protein ACXWCH_34640, partial [Burkholderiales bacterium]